MQGDETGICGEEAPRGGDASTDGGGRTPTRALHRASPGRRLLGAASVLAAMVITTGCTASVQKPAIEAMTANDGARAEAFEATLRVLDEHPEYVDEFFLLARQHRPTLTRFIQNTTREAHDPELAQLLAVHLIQHPDSLRQILIQSLDAAKDDPEAKAAIALAIERRAELAADVITESGPAVRAIATESIREVARKPEARAAMIQAVHASSPTLAQILVDNPKTLTAMMEQMIAAGGMDLVKKLVVQQIEGDDDDEEPSKSEPATSTPRDREAVPPVKKGPKPAAPKASTDPGPPS